MMFASKTPRNLNHDPEPYVLTYDGENERRVTEAYAAMIEAPYENVFDEVVRKHHDPRPEFDHPQCNEPNPILVALRTAMAVDAAWAIDRFQDALDADERAPEMIRATAREVSEAQRDHARLVLTRLAALTTTTERNSDVR